MRGVFLLWLKRQYSQFKIFFFLFTINLKAFHRIERSGALKNILCIFISIGTVRGTKRGRLRKTNKPWAWSSTPSPGGWSPTRLSTVLRLASHFLTQRCIFFCFRILTQSKALHNFLAWRWCSNDRPRKTNYYREIGICSFTLNLGKTNFYTSPLKKTALKTGDCCVLCTVLRLVHLQSFHVWKEYVLLMRF